MRIGEMGAQSGVTAKTVRYYESIGLLREPERTSSGYRSYGEGDVDRLTFVRTAQRLGITLDEIREILLFSERGEEPCSYVRGLLKTQLEGIRRRIEELQLLQAQLADIVAAADRLPPAERGLPCRLIEHVRQKSVPAASDPVRQPGEVPAKRAAQRART